MSEDVMRRLETIVRERGELKAENESLRAELAEVRGEANRLRADWGEAVMRMGLDEGASATDVMVRIGQLVGSCDALSESERWVLNHWPRYHDGSCVVLGELVGHENGDRLRAPLDSVEIDGDCATLWADGDHTMFGHGMPVTAYDPEPEYEPPADSWLAIEVDARRPEFEYCEERGIGRGQNAPAQRALMCADLVARCRALAGGEAR